jgi:hypothetical protein
MKEAALFFGVLGAFVAFVDEHKCCGDLDGGVDNGYVWLACSCGAQLGRPLPPRRCGQVRAWHWTDERSSAP